MASTVMREVAPAASVMTARISSMREHSIVADIDVAAAQVSPVLDLDPTGPDPARAVSATPPVHRRFAAAVQTRAARRTLEQRLADLGFQQPGCGGSPPKLGDRNSGARAARRDRGRIVQLHRAGCGGPKEAA